MPFTSTVNSAVKLLQADHPVAWARDTDIHKQREVPEGLLGSGGTLCNCAESVKCVFKFDSKKYTINDITEFFHFLR